MADTDTTDPTIAFRKGDPSEILRRAFGCFATGVTIVTALGEDGVPVGLTVNSFTSVSLDPPLLLVCPARDAGSTMALENADRFAVSVLGDDAHELSTLFAAKGRDRFAQGEWSSFEGGAPYLDHALAAFDCRVHAVHEGGDHLILVGEVESARFREDENPLLYYRGSYHLIGER